MSPRFVRLVALPIYAGVIFSVIAFFVALVEQTASNWIVFFVGLLSILASYWWLFYMKAVDTNSLALRKLLGGATLIYASMLFPLLGALLLWDQGWLILYVGAGPFLLIGFLIFISATSQVFIKKS